MGGTGNVHIAVTTKDPLAQQFFDQGLGQLHGFWYFESERSFRQAADIDPECAMAYWGMAMANFSNEKRSKAFIEKAVAKKGTASRREQLWIDGLNNYLNPKGKDAKVRRTELIKSLDDIVLDFPEELEAKAFLAWAMWEGSGQVPITSYQAINAIISEVLAKEPLHPVHHYRIHLWDGRKPALATASSALCGQGSPNVAHMWHMPGHIYWKLQRYQDSAWQQEAAGRVDHANMIHDRVMPYQIHNYAHNHEWLNRSLNYVGRARDAVDLAKNLIELPRHPQKNHLKNRGGAAWFGRTRLFETLGRYEMWDEVLALADSMYLEPTEHADEQIKRLRLLGLAQLGKGNIDAVKVHVAALETMQKTAKADQDKAGADAEEKAKKENQAADKAADKAAEKAAEKIAKAKSDAERPHAAKVSQAETALAELNARLAMTAGDKKMALALFEKVKDLAKEQQSQFYLEGGDHAKAEKLAKEAVDAGKNQVLPLANQADVLYRIGKTKEAGEAFKQLRELSAWMDQDVAASRRLEPLAKEQGLAPDWRIAYAAPGDTGNRPTLDSIGPFRWRPSPAPAFEITDTAGHPCSLKQYQGKPVVLIFYLGAGCLHCVEQLKKFAPMSDKFAQAGISLAAVSTDSTAELCKSLQNFSETGEFAFPLMSSADLSAFKAYRAHDDFEDKPLHGIFLIDGQGLIRWQDIGPDPFNDAAFLLEESQRLLSLPNK